MPNTVRFGYPYPGITDTPDVVRDLKALAEGVEGWTARAIPCTSTTRPTSPPTCMIIRESDTGGVFIYNGSAWEQINIGSVISADYQASANSNQSVARNTDVVVAFGTEDTTTALVTRNTRGAGHDFTLGASGLWSICATVRYAFAGTDGERYAGFYAAGAPTDAVISQGNGDESCASTLTFSATRRFAAGTVLYVQTRQATSGTRQMERGVNGCWVRVNLSLVG